MTRAIVWKEFREQGLIGLTLLVLGGGVLVAAALFADPPAEGAGPADVLRYLGAGRLATLLLAVTAGTVCGGALFAAEREAGTIGFLESLPATRWDLWRAKLTAGGVLAGGQIGAVVVVAAALGLVGTVGWAVAVVVYALLAFCWGAYGSTVARTTLGSVGVAVPAGALATFVYLTPILIVFHHPNTSLPRAEGGLLFLGLMFATPLALSAFAFTRADRERAADGPRPAGRLADAGWDPMGDPAPRPRAGPTADVGGRLGLAATAWLTARQLAGPGFVMSLFAVGFGGVLLVPLVVPVLVWPPLALTAGVLAGVTAFADEQGRGVARFWGEQRLPVGRAWAVKVGLHALFGLWLVGLLALPSALVAADDGGGFLSGVFRTRLFDPGHLGPAGWTYLLAPLAYGFAAGHVCGLLFKKVVVAAGVAGLVGGTAAALPLPGLLAGGVYPWQVWLPPAAALATARLVIRAWGSDRVITRGPLLALSGGAGAVLLVLAAGVGWRVLEVPDAPGGEDDQRYVKSDELDQKYNQTGRDFRSAAEAFGRAEAVMPVEGPRPAAEAGGQAGVEGRMAALVPPGVAGSGSEVVAYLTRVYNPAPRVGETMTWFRAAAIAAEQPTGLFEHPVLTGTTEGARVLDNGRRMGVAVTAHGLWRQAAGDPAAFPPDLRTALALGRNLRNGSIVPAFEAGYEVARYSLTSIDRWLERLPADRPDLLRAALAAVAEDERAVPIRVRIDGGELSVSPAATPAVGADEPFDPTPHVLAERYTVREKLKAPSNWLPAEAAAPGRPADSAAPVADLVQFAWTVPWEKERTRRLVGLGADRRAGLVDGRPGSGLLRQTPDPARLTDLDRQLRVLRRAAAVKLAVRLFMAEHGGRPPAALAGLVPDYLPAVPPDPHADGGPFRYRVEPSGRPVVWSVGLDGLDDGGREEADLAFPVPLPAK